MNNHLTGLRNFHLPEFRWDADVKKFMTLRQKGSRECSPEAYEEKSNLDGKLSFYDRYLLRAVSHVSTFTEPISRMQAYVGNDLLQQNLVSSPTEAQEQVYNGCANVDTLHGDIYRALMGAPETVKYEKKNSFIGNMLERVFNSDEWGDLKEAVGKDPIKALTSATSILNSLSYSDAVKEELEKDAQQTNQQEDLSDERSEDNETESAENSPGSGDQDQQEDSGESEDSSGNGEGGSEDSGEQGNEAGSGEGISGGSYEVSEHSAVELQDLIAEALRGAVKETDSNEEAKEIGVNLANGLLAGSGAAQEMDDIAKIKDIVTTSERLISNPGYKNRVERLYNLLGRAESLMGTALSKSKHGDGEVVDVVQSGDITRTLASEYASLAVPGLETLYYIKLAEERLASWERKGVDDAGKGALVIMMDVSGSTDSDIRHNGYGAPLYQWLMVFSLAFIKYARKWNRAVAIVPFNTSCIWSTAIVIDPAKPKTVSQLRAELDEFLTTHGSGCTSFIAPLHELKRELPNMFSSEAANEMDIVFFTDGAGDIDYRMEREAKEVRKGFNGARVFSLMISDTSDQAYLDNLEYRNGFLFDVGVACTLQTLEEGMDRMFRAIVEKSFYALETE